MDAYYKEFRKLEGKFYDIEYKHVVQEKNKAADALSKLGYEPMSHMACSSKILSTHQSRKKKITWSKSL
jgi:hypothetical protein